MRAALALVVAAALAGCSGGASQAPPEGAAAFVVEGFVVDARLLPIAGAPVVALGQGANATTDASGHFLLRALAAQDLVLLVAPPGYVAQSRAVSAFSGSHAWVNLTLEAVAFAAPYHQTEMYRATVQCGVSVVAGEDPSRPHEHRGVKCSDHLPSPTSVWNYTVPVNTTGLILEAFWEPGTPASTALVLKATMVGTGEVLAFVEGMSPLKQQVSRVSLQQNVAAGHDVLSVELRPGAGTGQHDHGAVGAFVQQQVQLFATAFFNGPVDPAFTVASG